MEHLVEMSKILKFPKNPMLVSARQSLHRELVLMLIVAWHRHMTSFPVPRVFAHSFTFT